MRTIYIDSNNHCHVTNDGTMIPVETDFFDDKCDIFIEGYCLKNNLDTVIYPWKPYMELIIAQREYELSQLQEYKNKEQELNTSYNEGINSI